MRKNSFMHCLNQMSNNMDRVAKDIDFDSATETTCMLDWNTAQVSTSADSSLTSLSDCRETECESSLCSKLKESLDIHSALTIIF